MVPAQAGGMTCGACSLDRRVRPLDLEKSMTTKQAIEKLEGWQSQIIHGPNSFGAIADHIQELQEALDRANELCRSAYVIAQRDGCATDWERWRKWLKEHLEHQHALLWPNENKISDTRSTAWCLRKQAA